MSTQQPEALRLADALLMGSAMIPEIDLPEAAAELRRLHARVQELEGQRNPLTDEQIEGLPIWANFVGLWPESRQEITRAIERSHGIT